ncbi:MAG: Flp family type IVb pilin [Chloroflexota bacterium]
MELIKRLVVEEEGADATEYALVIGLVALAIIGGAMALGKNLSSAFNTVSTTVSSCVPSGGTNCTAP